MPLGIRTQGPCSSCVLRWLHQGPNGTAFTRRPSACMITRTVLTARVRSVVASASAELVAKNHAFGSSKV
eukprot:7711706-Pyramimonas_sp.AAC.1